MVVAGNEVGVEEKVGGTADPKNESESSEEASVIFEYEQGNNPFDMMLKLMKFHVSLHKRLLVRSMRPILAGWNK